MSAFVRLFLMLAVVTAITSCSPVTDVPQPSLPSVSATSTPITSALKQVSPRPPSPTPTISDPASSYPYPLETTKELVGQWVTYGSTGGPEISDIKPARIELELRPDNTYSYYTPALQGYGLVADELIDIPAMQRYGKWRMGKSSYWQRRIKEGGFWEACCICITPDDEDEKDRGGCEPYSLQGDNLITPAFYIPQLGDVVVRAREWKKTK